MPMMAWKSYMKKSTYFSWKMQTCQPLWYKSLSRVTEDSVKRWLPHKLQESYNEIKEPQDTFAKASTCLQGIKKY